MFPSAHASAAPPLVPPSPVLANCVRGYVSHHSPKKSQPAKGQHTHWPAALTCAITWFIDERNRRSAQPVLFTGPRTQALVHEGPKSAQSFVVLLMPDALRAMAKLDLTQHVNRFSGLAESFDAAWRRMAQAVQDAPNDARRIALIEEFLEPRWRAVCEQTETQVRRTQERWHDWLKNLSDRAQEQGVGRSMRQAQRRVKDWAGLSLRQMQGVARVESALAQLREYVTNAQLRKHPLDWARIAFDNGFADQSHLCREIRRASGLSPTQLHKAVDQDEGFWLYRLPVSQGQTPVAANDAAHALGDHATPPTRPSR